MRYALIAFVLTFSTFLNAQKLPDTEFDFVVKGSSSVVLANGGEGRNWARFGYRNSIGGGTEFWRIFQVQAGYSHLYKESKNLNPKEIGYSEYGLMMYRIHEHNIYTALSLRVPIPKTSKILWAYGEARMDFNFSRVNTSYGRAFGIKYPDPSITIPTYNQAYLGLGMEIFIEEEIVLNILGFRMYPGTFKSPRKTKDAFEGFGLEVGVYYRFLD